MNKPLSDLLQRFQKPDVWHLPATYWFWHTIPSHQQIDQQLLQLREGGYGSFQIAARLSLPLEQYLSDEWLAACRYTADKAADMGLMMGVYDDYNWLSGHAGGRTVAGHDELRERHLFWSQAHGNALEKVITCAISGIRSADAQALQQCGMEWIFEDGKPAWDEWEVVAAYATPAFSSFDTDSIVDVASLARVVETSQDGLRVEFDVDTLPWREKTIVTLFTAARCRTSRMINYLMPEAAKNFIRVGYEPYARAFGEHFGKTVAYMFFDQPHSCFWQWNEHSGSVKSSLMFDHRLIDALKMKGGQLPEILLSLVMDIGERTARRRCEFFSCYSQLAMTSFFGELAAWCRQRNVLLSGHEVLGHVSSWDFASKIITEDNRCNFAMDYFALDGWRDITAVDSRNNEPQMAAKVGDSVARAHGRKGCIVEQYYARVRPGTHFAAGQWELSLHETRRQAFRHHLLGARQFLMHAFWLTDGTADDSVLSNPRFDFAPGINFQPWYPFHASFAHESGRLAEFLDAGNPYIDIGVIYPKRTFWYFGIDGEEGATGARWAQKLSAEGYEYFFIDEENLLQAQDRLINGERYAALLLPDMKVVKSAETLQQLERFVHAGGRLLVAGGEITHSEEKGADNGLNERLRRLIDNHAQCCFMQDEFPDNLKTERPYIEFESQGKQVWTRITHDDDAQYITLFNDNDTPLYAWLHFPTLCGQLYEWDIATGEVHCLAEDVNESYPVRVDAWAVRCFSLQTNERTRSIALDSNWQLMADNISRPVDVNQGWETQGLEDWCGVGRYQLNFELDAIIDDAQLYLPEVSGCVEVWLNGEKIGEKGWPDYRFMLSAHRLRKENALTIVVYPSAANHYYAKSAWQGERPDACGLTAAPYLRTNNVVKIVSKFPHS